MQTKQITHATQIALTVEGMQPVSQVLQATQPTQSPIQSLAQSPTQPLTQVPTQSEETMQMVRCPNCGELAERHHLSGSHITRTQCASCDYLMILCTKTGRVLEAYAPGIWMSA